MRWVKLQYYMCFNGLGSDGVIGYLHSIPESHEGTLTVLEVGGGVQYNSEFGGDVRVHRCEVEHSTGLAPTQFVSARTQFTTESPPPGSTTQQGSDLFPSATGRRSVATVSGSVPSVEPLSLPPKRTDTGRVHPFKQGIRP
jgi:hypothetical protein